MILYHKNKNFINALIFLQNIEENIIEVNFLLFLDEHIPQDVLLFHQRKTEALPSANSIL